ncbi:hypothetical protein Tco_0930260 [Tanacetum coccineum]
MIHHLAEMVDGVDSEIVGVPRSTIVNRSQSNGIVADQGVRSVADIESNGSPGRSQTLYSYYASSIICLREVLPTKLNVLTQLDIEFQCGKWIQFAGMVLFSQSILFSLL